MIIDARTCTTTPAELVAQAVFLAELPDGMTDVVAVEYVKPGGRWGLMSETTGDTYELGRNDFNQGVTLVELA